ncbi:MAG: arginase family protein [Hyphomicrobiales bacterium]
MAKNKKKSIDMLYGSKDARKAFLGLPRCKKLKKLDADVAIIGAPCATPYPSVGAYCRDAPDAIRAAIAGYGAAVDHMDFDLGGPLLGDPAKKVVDCGNLKFDEADAGGNRKRIRSAVSRILEHEAVPIVIGGDDSIPIPVFEAYEGRGPFTILQIDAHIDWRDTSEGVRFGLSSTMRRASEMDQIDRIIQCGQRAVGSARPSDHRDALDWGVEFFVARELYIKGVDPVLDAIPSGANVLISLDVDALDPSICPAVLARAPGGLSYWQVVNLIQGVARKANIAGFNIIELVPEQDIDRLGALTAARIICNAIGTICRQS